MEPISAEAEAELLAIITELDDRLSAVQARQIELRAELAAAVVEAMQLGVTQRAIAERLATSRETIRRLVRQTVRPPGR